MADIFLVDDDRTIIEVYHNMLEIKGHRIIGEAFDGESAVNEYEKMSAKPDIVLMDHRMPFKNGLLAMDDIRAMNPAQCIIFVTADFEAAKVALKKGASSFIIKPFRMDVLFNSIEMAHLEEKKKSAELKESYLGIITRIGESGDSGSRAGICEMVEKEMINNFIPEDSQVGVSMEVTINWLCEFFNFMGMSYTYKREKNRFIIRNNKCIWMDELGQNPNFCFMAKCVISKFAKKTGMDFELSVKKAIMDGSDECYFEIVFTARHS